MFVAKNHPRYVDGAKVHLDLSKMEYSTQSAKQIERIHAEGAGAAYNTEPDIAPATRGGYLDQEADRVSKVIQSHTVKAVLAVELPNGLGEYAHLDSDGRIVSTYWDSV